MQSSVISGLRDVDVFEKAGLLTNRCVLAHGVHLNDRELRLLAKRGASIAHCPLSNFFFANGVNRTAILKVSLDTMPRAID